MVRRIHHAYVCITGPDTRKYCVRYGVHVCIHAYKVSYMYVYMYSMKYLIYCISAQGACLHAVHASVYLYIEVDKIHSSSLNLYLAPH